MRALPQAHRGGTIQTLVWIVCFASSTLWAQEPSARLSTAIENSSRMTISGSLQPLVKSHTSSGQVPSSTKLQGISMVFSRSAAQEADLKALVTAQQTPGSSSYHQWLTPDQFAARFGMASSDLETIESWLEQQGFSVDRVARSKNRITFSGTAGQVGSAFGTQLNYYTVGGKKIFAPASDLTIPAALFSVVQSVGNLTSLRPKPHHVNVKSLRLATKSNFTSSESGDHYLSPADIRTIYDITAAYNAGYTGTGQSIAVVGQSSIALSDIENFQSAASLTTKDPTLVLVPDSGSAAIVSGDESESDLDLEWSGAIAKGATIYFVYVGNNSNYSVWDSIEYAVDTRVAPIISISYGACETELDSSDKSALESILEQAASQGQSVIAASGDDGSTDCYEDTDLTASQREALAVDYPASSPYVTGIGGTEFSGDTSDSSAYWESASGSDVISSALKYIPEEAWNDDSSTDGIGSGGGGKSSLFSKPSWQTGVSGIPSDGMRDVPDISLDASADHDGYLICSSDETETGITGSCSNGFRNASAYLTVFGGTSFGAPIFSGMLAILNQKLNSTGQGVINSTLYAMASDSTTYASAFHDVTSGSNKCTAGSSYCDSAGESEYAATTGYDQATGLGSVDFDELLTNWPTSTSSDSSLTATTTSLSAASTTPASGASDTITITVANSSSSSSITTIPTGTLTILVDGTRETSALALSTGSATYTFSSTTTGSHVIVAEYSGDSIYAASDGTTTVTVGGSSTSSSGSFTLAATSATATQGSSASSTITVTSKNSYAGTVDLTLSTTNTSLEDYGCYDVADPTLTAGSTATETLIIYTSESACSSSSSTKKGTRHRFVKKTGTKSIAALAGEPTSHRTFPVGMAATFAGFLLFGIGRRRSRLWAALSCFLLLAIAGLSLAGCGSNSSSRSSSTTTDVSKGTYTLTLDGTDSSNSSITAETTFTLTVN